MRKVIGGAYELGSVEERACLQVNIFKRDIMKSVIGLCREAVEVLVRC